MLDLNWDGLDAGRHDRPARVPRSSATTERFDHCVFTVRAGFRADSASGVARRAVRDGLRRPDAPRDDGPRGPQGMAAGPHERASAR